MDYMISIRRNSLKKFDVFCIQYMNYIVDTYEYYKLNAAALLIE